MSEINRYSGGFILHKRTLSKYGKLYGDGLPTKCVSNCLVQRAFYEAERAMPLPSNTKFSMGCVRSPDSVSVYYEYNGKTFAGTPLLHYIFS